MERKKALLAVTGGRGLPDFLALFCVRPHLVAILTSEEGWDEEHLFTDAVSSLPHFEQLLPTQQVPSYNMEVTRETCLQICRCYPQDEWEWTFSIGSCPKIMGIGAYEVAKEMNIPCIYMDAQHEKVVSLVKALDSVPPNIFHLKVDDYLKIYGREADSVSLSERQYRKQVEDWGDIARTIALSPAGSLFAKQARNQKVGHHIPFSSSTPELVQLLENLENYGAIKTQRRESSITCTFTSKDFVDFLGSGSWLEVYVWNEARNKGFADDYQWGYKIIDTRPPTATSTGKAPNELDGLFMYRAQLILVECKTDEAPFKGELHYLDKVNDKSDMLGRSYVTKIFVTNASKKSEEL